ncbi:MAG: hypothetical protein ACREB9_05650, partial [Thermoplasmata archaeon]
MAVEGGRPWLWDHVKSVHSFTDRRLYAEIEGELERQRRKEGVSIHRRDQPAEPGGAGLVLVSGLGEIEGTADPHRVTDRRT